MATRLSKKQLATLIAATRNVSVSNSPSTSQKRRRRRRRNKGSTNLMNTVTVPAAMSVTQRRVLPRLSGGVGEMTVSHTEIVTTIGVSSTFNAQTYRLIPSFPSWLSGLSRCFSKYRWLRLRAVYIPSCPSTTSGAIHMALRYDETDTAVSSSAEISAMYGYTTGAVWSGSSASALLSKPNSPCPSGAICVDVDVGRLEKPWYTWRAAASVPAGLDLANTYIPATLVVGTEGGSSTSDVASGHIHWIYSIHCVEPVPSAVNS